MAADEFIDIRPYRDVEVADVIARLVEDSELLLAVMGFVVPWLPAVLRPFAVPWLRAW